MTKEFITRTSRMLNENLVEYVVTGGVAAILHGCKIETYDFDILITLSEKNLKAVENFIYQLTGKKTRLDRENNITRITRVSSFPFSIDILPKLDGLDTNSVFKNSRLISWQDYNIPVISENDLNINYKSLKL